ncbi:MAG TPA: glycosyltransferase [Mucilaginibacter sp.]
MNRKVLIISPYFPPVNVADMQRIRMSLPYFKNFGWDAEVVTVDPRYSDLAKDDLLIQSIPLDITIHQVNALDKTWTSRLGLGNIALRSLPFYKKKVNQLLHAYKFDLIYFSTTQFPICVLGKYWKKKFNIPYVIDMQDPWHSEYYKDKPKHQRPPKYWFSYRLNKYLEPIAMKQLDGLMAVSEQYINDLKTRYPAIKNVPEATITFGAFEPDMEIAEKNRDLFKSLIQPGFTNLVYIGRGGADMHKAVGVLFKALQQGLQTEKETYGKLKVYFIGTSYAPRGQGKPTISPLAKQYGLDDHVVEITDRISYYQTLITLNQADALFIPGSDDPKYTASKIYPYLLTGKPLLTIFNSESPAISVLKDYGVKFAYSYDSTDNISLKVIDFFRDIINGPNTPQNYNKSAIKKYSAENMTRQQCHLFDKIMTNNI